MTIVREGQAPYAPIQHREPGRTGLAVTLCVFAGFIDLRHALFVTIPTLPKSILTPRDHGGWLAVSAPGEILRLAVVGEDEATARQDFARSAERWLELCEAARVRDDE